MTEVRLITLSDLGQIVQDLVMHAIDKVGVIFVCADVFERKDSNALSLWNGFPSEFWRTV
jgi:hypothetical protein